MVIEMQIRVISFNKFMRSTVVVAIERKKLNSSRKTEKVWKRKSMKEDDINITYRT